MSTPACGNQRRRSIGLQSGFTLVELLVTIAILATIAAMLMPSIQMVMRSANTTVCMSNLRQIGTAIFGYSGDHNGSFPMNNNTECSSWPHIFGDWGTGQRGVSSNFHRAYLPAGRRLYFCPTGLQAQRRLNLDQIGTGYENFPNRGSHWVSVINYSYFAGRNEHGSNTRRGPKNEAQATSNSTIIGDLMRFGAPASSYTSGVRFWNHLGSPYQYSGITLTDKSGGHLFHGDGSVRWIGGLQTLLANRQAMRGNNERSYVAVQEAAY